MNSDELVKLELLCFLQQKSKIMTFGDLVSICTDFCNSDEVRWRRLLCITMCIRDRQRLKALTRITKQLPTCWSWHWIQMFFTYICCNWYFSTATGGNWSPGCVSSHAGTLIITFWSTSHQCYAAGDGGDEEHCQGAAAVSSDSSGLQQCGESKQALLNSSKAHNCAITARAAGSSTQQS